MCLNKHYEIPFVKVYVPLTSTLGCPLFVDHLGAVSSPALGNPRRVRHVPEQISVERKFVEECAVLFPSQNNRPPQDGIE